LATAAVGACGISDQVRIIAPLETAVAANSSTLGEITAAVARLRSTALLARDAVGWATSEQARHGEVAKGRARARPCSRGEGNEEEEHGNITSTVHQGSSDPSSFDPSKFDPSKFDHPDTG
tara:strand:- start:1239 stop:1601 length:363 start_codon:yes stop_codon:yes gene_type:complete